MHLRILFAAAALSVLALQPAQANIITNPGFETGDFTGWTLGGNIPDFIGVDGFAVHSGSQSAFFGPVGTPATLTQSLTTTPGGTYELTFWLQNELAGDNLFQVLWNGNLVDALVDSALFNYTLFTFSGLTATGTSTDLQFAFVNEDSFWDFDDVSVELTGLTAVPEPGSLALFGLGALGIGLLRRRRSGT